MAGWATLDVAGTFLTALLLGGMAFHSFVMTPLVFAKMEREAAGAFLRESFAIYYKVMAGVSILAALALWQRPEGAALAAVAVLFAGLIVFLLPAAARTREGRDAGVPRAIRTFKALHRLSVLINLLQIIVAAMVLVRLAA